LTLNQPSQEHDMSVYGGQELANAFRTVRKNTVQIAEDIPEDKYDFSAAPGVSTVGALLRHLVVSPTLYEDMHGTQRVTTLAGYDFPGIVGRMREQENKPLTKAETVAALKSEGERFATWLESLSPEFLAETFATPTGQNTRLGSLLSPKEHEMHHRGQLMLVERMLGIVPHLTREREARQRPTA
jgi:uncharacterized damage-inducible protein DinB